MPAVGFTLFSRTATYAPCSRNESIRMTSDASSCATENWVGINKKDFYSLIDKIYNSEEERVLQGREEPSTSPNNPEVSSRDYNELRHYKRAADSLRKRSSDVTKQIAVESLNIKRIESPRAPEEEIPKLLPIFTESKLPEMAEGSLCHDEAELPLDLTRHPKLVQAPPSACYPQTASLSLLAGVSSLSQHLNVMKPTANKTKVNNNKARDNKHSKDSRASHDGKQQPEMAALSQHSKPTPKTSICELHYDGVPAPAACDVIASHSKCDVGPHPKECWVPINKNMVVNLVENLVEDSLCASGENALLNTTVEESDRLAMRSPDTDAYTIKNSEHFPSETINNNSGHFVFSTSDVTKSRRNSVSDNDIDVEEIDQTSESENGFINRSISPPNPGLTAQYTAAVAAAVGKGFTLTQSGSASVQCNPRADNGKSEKNRMLVEDPEKCIARKRSSTSQRTRKRSHHDATGLARGDGASPKQQWLEQPATAVTLDRTRSRSEPKESSLATISPMEASLRASVLLSLAYDPLMVKHLQDQFRDGCYESLESMGLSGAAAANLRYLPPHLTTQQPRSPTRVHHSPPVATNNMLIGQHIRDAQRMETSTPSACSAMLPQFSHESRASPERTIQEDSSHSNENDTKNARDSPKLGWVAVSKKDVHTIVDSVMHTMISSDMDQATSPVASNTQEHSGEQANHSHDVISSKHSSNQRSSLTPPSHAEVVSTSHQRTCDQRYDVIDSDRSSDRDVSMSSAPSALATVVVSPTTLTSLSPRSDRSLDDRSISNVSPNSVCVSPSSADVSTNSVTSSRGFKWKSSLLKRAREEGDEDRTPSPTYDSNVTSPPRLQHHRDNAHSPSHDNAPSPHIRDNAQLSQFSAVSLAQSSSDQTEDASNKRLRKTKRKGPR